MNCRARFPLLLLLLFGLSSVQPTLAWFTNGGQVLPPANQSRVGFPQVVVDESGIVHVVWMEINSDLRAGPVRYTRGQLLNDGTGQPTITWEGAQRITGSEASSSNIPRIAVANGGIVYIAFGTRDDFYVVARNDQRGAANSWTEDLRRSVTGGSAENFGVTLALDDAGTPYVAWSTGFGQSAGSRIVLTYRNTNGSWTEPRQFSNARFLATDLRMAVSGSGSDAIVQIAYETQVSDKSDLIVYHTRGSRDGNFADINLSAVAGAFVSTDPAITIDASTGITYAAFVRPDGDNRFTLNLLWSTDAGVTWPSANQRTFDQGTGIWPGASQMIAINETVYIVSEQKFNFAEDIRVYVQTYNRATDQRSNYERVSSDEPSGAPSLGIGGIGKAIVYGANGLDDIKYSLELGGLPVPPPVASITINDGSARTSSTNVTVNFTVTSATNNLQYKISNNAADLGDLSGFQPLPESRAVSWQLQTPTSMNTDCEVQTVYAVVRDAGIDQISAIAQDNIQYDPGLDLRQVVVENPNLPRNLNTRQDLGSSYAASDGDPRYTRSDNYYGAVFAGAGECSQLQTVRFGNTLASGLPGTATSGIFTLPTGDDGPQTVAIQIEDGSNYRDERTVILYRDRQRPTITNGNLAQGSEIVQIIDNTGNVISETNSILVDFRFTNLQVTDNLYGTNGESAPFWGLWVVNSTVPVSVTNPDDLARLNTLNWSPVEVTTVAPSGTPNGSSFTIKLWSLIGGLAQPNLGTTQTIYPCFRVLDGAGNASTETFCSSGIVLTDQARLPQIYGPVLLTTGAPGS